MHPGYLYIVAQIMKVRPAIFRINHIDRHVMQFDAGPYGPNQELRIECHALTEAVVVDDRNNRREWVEPKSAQGIANFKT